MLLENKNAVIYGGGESIGGAVAREFARGGARIFLAGRTQAKLEAVASDIELDTEPREVTVPPDLAEALDRDADAMRLFDGLSYSKKQRIVNPIEQAKSAETRQRRIANAICERTEPDTGFAGRGRA